MMLQQNSLFRLPSYLFPSSTAHFRPPSSRALSRNVINSDVFCCAINSAQTLFICILLTRYDSATLPLFYQMLLFFNYIKLVTSLLFLLLYPTFKCMSSYFISVLLLQNYKECSNFCAHKTKQQDFSIVAFASLPLT